MSRPLCHMQLNFDVFDHFLKVKVAETFWGAPAPPSPPTMGGKAPQIPQHQGPRSKKPCASVNNVGPGRKLVVPNCLLAAVPPKILHHGFININVMAHGEGFSKLVIECFHHRTKLGCLIYRNQGAPYSMTKTVYLLTDYSYRRLTRTPTIRTSD